MKKMLLGAVIFLCLFFVVVGFANPVESSDWSFTSSDAAYAQEVLHSSINYQLPYPGLLPDSPLYFLKMIRDKIVGFLISDPLKKAQFDLLQSEKRVNSGLYLSKKGEIDLAQSTISKGGNYFGEAISSLKQAEKQGEDVKSLINTMVTSSLKQQEVIHDILLKLPKKQQMQFLKEEQRLIDFRNLVKHIVND